MFFFLVFWRYSNGFLHILCVSYWDFNETETKINNYPTIWDYKYMKLAMKMMVTKRNRSLKFISVDVFTTIHWLRTIKDRAYSAILGFFKCIFLVFCVFFSFNFFFLFDTNLTTLGWFYREYIYMKMAKAMFAHKGFIIY
jgi:hypothetical protein